MAECLLGMMLTGSGAYLLWAAQCRVTGERFSARWQYRLLKVVMGFFLLPVGLLVGGGGAGGDARRGCCGRCDDFACAGGGRPDAGG